jgi:hypothetical protein
VYIVNTVGLHTNEDMLKRFIQNQVDPREYENLLKVNRFGNWGGVLRCLRLGSALTKCSRK